MAENFKCGDIITAKFKVTESGGTDSVPLEPISADHSENNIPLYVQRCSDWTMDQKHLDCTKPMRFVHTFGRIGLYWNYYSHSRILNAVLSDQQDKVAVEYMDPSGKIRLDYYNRSEVENISDNEQSETNS